MNEKVHKFLADVYGIVLIILVVMAFLFALSEGGGMRD